MKTIVNDNRLSNAIKESLRLQKDTISINNGLGQEFYVGCVDVDYKDGWKTYSYIISPNDQDGTKLRGTYKRVDRNDISIASEIGYAHCCLEVELIVRPNKITKFGDVTLYM